MRDNTSQSSFGHRLKIIPLLTLFLLQAGFTVVLAETSAVKVKKMSEKTVEVGITAQQNHEAWVEEENQLLKEIDTLEQRLGHLEWQRQKLAVYRQGLEKKIIELEEKAAAMEAVNLELLPILEKNLVGLNEYLKADLPYDLGNRRKSLLHAQAVMNDYDMGLLDKTRAVLDAAAREVDLGHRVAVREDEIEVNGDPRRVKMLQVGRVCLYAVTLDNQKAYRWDKGSGRWTTAENDISAIREAVEIVEGIRLVGLSRLTVDQPVAVEAQEEQAR